MDRRIVQVFYGPGKGKTSAAVGQCIRAASLGQSVIIIQFLKGNDAEEFNFLEKLEPDIKLFRFEKAAVELLPTGRSLSAATDAIGRCVFIGTLYELEVPSRDCHVASLLAMTI